MTFPSNKYWSVQTTCFCWFFYTNKLNILQCFKLFWRHGIFISEVSPVLHIDTAILSTHISSVLTSIHQVRSMFSCIYETYFCDFLHISSPHGIRIRICSTCLQFVFAAIAGNYNGQHFTYQYMFPYSKFPAHNTAPFLIFINNSITFFRFKIIFILSNQMFAIPILFCILNDRIPC